MITMHNLKALLLLLFLLLIIMAVGSPNRLLVHLLRRLVGTMKALMQTPCRISCSYGADHSRLQLPP
jgi:hypothetical protein